jgi:hypothetical protein
VLAIVAVLALATWQLDRPWWRWALYGLLVGTLLTLARHDHEHERP